MIFFGSWIFSKNLSHLFGRVAEADHLRANMATLSAAKIVYSAGFFITVSPESMETLGEPRGCSNGG